MNKSKRMKCKPWYNAGIGTADNRSVAIPDSSTGNLRSGRARVPPLTPVEVRMGGRPSRGMRLEELLMLVLTSAAALQPYGPHASCREPAANTAV